MGFKTFVFGMTIFIAFSLILTAVTGISTMQPEQFWAGAIPKYFLIGASAGALAASMIFLGALFTKGEVVTPSMIAFLTFTFGVPPCVVFGWVLWRIWYFAPVLL